MQIRVLVVDDSRFFRRRVTEMLESDPRIKVIGYAENGNEAVQKASRLKPDVITMDIEMPLMDGITATKRILATQKIPILMFSSLTTEGAQATLDALDAGAVDYLPKRFEEISANKADANKKLCERVVSVSRYHRTPAVVVRTPPPARSTPVPPSARAEPVVRIPTVRAGSPFRATAFKLLAIGTSTGGPVALQIVLSRLPTHFPLPIVLYQHMPGSFTGAFAERLNKVCNIEVVEAKDNDSLKPGIAYLAPGGKQMTIVRSGSHYVVRVTASDPSLNYKPSVDLGFESIAKSGIGKVLAIILTGMGADGCQGAKLLSKNGSQIWAQSEDSCVVAGMPSAVIEAGITSHILNLEDMATQLAQGS